MRKVFLIILSLVCVFTVLSGCSSKDTQTERTTAQEESTSGLNANSNTDLSNNGTKENDGLELIYNIENVVDYNGFFFKSNTQLFYLSEVENDYNSYYLSALDLSTGVSKQVAYVKNEPQNIIKCSESKLLFIGSENGYDMKLVQYDIASSTLSAVNQTEYTQYPEKGLCGQYAWFRRDDKLVIIDLNTGKETMVTKSILLDPVYSDVVSDPLNKNLLYFYGSEPYEYYPNYSEISETGYKNYIFKYSIDTGKLEKILDFNLIKGLTEDSSSSYKMLALNNIVYLFIEQKGVYIIQEGKLEKTSNYPKGENISSDDIVCNDGFIYYRAASPHNNTLIKLANGKETVQLPVFNNIQYEMTPTTSFTAQILGIYNDIIWYEFGDNGIAAVDKMGNIINEIKIFGKMIASDDKYYYCYGLPLSALAQQGGISNTKNPDMGFYKISVDNVTSK